MRVRLISPAFDVVRSFRRYTEAAMLRGHVCSNPRHRGLVRRCKSESGVLSLKAVVLGAVTPGTLFAVNRLRIDRPWALGTGQNTG